MKYQVYKASIRFFLGNSAPLLARDYGLSNWEPPIGALAKSLRIKL